MNVGDNIRHWRHEKSLTLKDLSELTGLSVSYLSDLERGRCTNVGIETLQQIAGVFGLTLSVFELSADEHALLNAYRAGDVVGVLKLLVKE